MDGAENAEGDVALKAQRSSKQKIKTAMQGCEKHNRSTISVPSRW